MRHRPTEIKELTALLDQEHDDIEQLAVGILDLLVDIKWRRGAYCVVTENLGHVFVHGPFANKQEAKRSIGREVISSAPGTARGGVFLVEPIEVLRERLGMDEEEVLF